MAPDASEQFPPEPVEHFQLGSLSCLRLRGNRSTIELAGQGAHLLSWRPENERPVLFVSKQSAFVPGKAIRGGVPLIFPWFGPREGHPRSPSHGFARTAQWKVESAFVDDSGQARARLSLPPSASQGWSWDHAFQAVFEVEADDELALRVRIENPGAASLTFEAALHTYFAVSDVKQVEVLGLENTEYLDKPSGNTRKRQDGKSIRLVGETDRLYLNTPATCTIVDRGWQRRIIVQKGGSLATVVWNPWSERASALDDLGPEEWPHMLCVETAAAAENRITLPPGESHVLEARVRVESA